MLHLVYPVGPRRGDLLKYALRSLDAHGGALDMEIQVTIVGHLPDYVDPHSVRHLRTPDDPDPFRHVWEAWFTTAANTLDWWWMNDDFMFTGPVADALVHRHRGQLASYVAALRGKPGTAPWRTRGANLLRALAEYGPTDTEPLCWETHRPMYASAGSVMAASEWARKIRTDPSKLAIRSMINVFEGYHARAVEAGPDPKIDTIKAVELPTPIVSVSARSWRTKTGEAIRAMYPRPSLWER